MGNLHMKTYYTQTNVGTARHTVSFHDGQKAHHDGSPFFDIRIFSNKRKRDSFCRELRKVGYTEK